MPRLDNTGPTGNGSMTGRGLGKCNSNSQSTNGQGMGNNNGMGRRCNQNAGGNGANKGQQNNSILSQVLAELKHLTNRVLHLEGNK